MRNLLKPGSYLFTCLFGISLLSLLAACGPGDPVTPTAAPTSGVPSAIEPTKWGGQGIGIEILTDSVKLSFRCDSGVIKVPLVTDSSGAFDLPGTFGWCQALCVSDLPARYQGHIIGFPLTYHVSQLTLTVSWEYKGKVYTSDTYTATIGQEPIFAGSCPKCLAGATLIDTPNGQVPVKDLREGMLVWTSIDLKDNDSSRQAVPISRTSRTEVPPDYKIIHLQLEKGLDLFVSPGHPTADGRLFGMLNVGDVVDGSRVSSYELVPYDEGYTYDILPSGVTATYWANGILIGSTLAGSLPDH